MGTNFSVRYRLEKMLRKNKKNRGSKTEMVPDQNNTQMCGNQCGPEGNWSCRQ